MATTARTAAYAALVERVTGFPELHRYQVDRGDLEARDARLAVAIDHQVSLRWLTLQAMIEPHLKQSWTGLKPVVQAALLGGTVQLLLMDRVPDHAVLNETVEWIKQSSQPRASGLVNAVLRRICDLRKGRVEQADPDRQDVLLRSDGSGIELARPILSADPLERLHQQANCPMPLLKHWQQCHGEAEARRLALHGIADAPIIVSGVDGEQADTLTSPHDMPGYRVVRPGHSALEVLQAHPNAIIQDPASAEPIRATLGLEPGCILDLCAGRGTKTRLLSKHHPKSRIIATDIDIKLIDDLKASTRDCGNVEIRPFKQLGDLNGQIDLLVLDVPCSNTAVLARRPEARYRYSKDTLAELGDRQRQLMADALPLLGPSGKILYATCSLEPAENTEQTRWLTQWHRFRVETERLMSPSGLPGDPSERYHDGSYHALLAR